MTQEEKNEHIARAMNVSTEVLAQKIITTPASTIGRLIVETNRARRELLRARKLAQREREIGEFEDWKKGRM